MNTLVIEKQTGGYFKFTLNGDTANAITSIQNDLLAVGTQLHFKTGNGANIIKEQFIYPADVTIIASGTFTFTTVAQVWDKLIDIDYFAWLGGGGTGGVDRFDDLLDTFSYTGNAGKAVVVDGSELRLVPITLYNKRLFTELEDTPSSLVPNKMLVVNPAGTAVVLQDQPEQPEQLLNSVGYFDYNDLITQTTPLNAVANVALKLTNDTEGANTSTDQNPYGVSYVWDYTTNQFNFNELEVGDTIDVRVHIQVTTTSANQRVLLSAKFGIGSVAEFTNIIYENQFKSAGLHEINFVAPFYMGSTYITDNPAELYLTTDSSATVKVDGWYVRILRKNINIITVDYTVPDATGSVKGIVRLAGDLAGTANSPTVPELANKVPNTRTVSTTSPLLGGGALSSNLTLSIQQANSVDSGYLSNVDWSTFNGKANDNAVVKLTGDQSITGSKSFTTNTAAPAMVVTNNSTDNGILLQNTSTGNALRINNGALSTGDLIRAGKDGSVTFIVNQNGNTTAASFIKSGGTSSQFLKADGSVDSSTYALTSQLHDAVTLGTTGVLNGLSLSGQVLSLATASSTTRGALTAEDYSYFFGKQNALTNPVTGTGTSGQVAFWNGTSSITGESNLFWDSTNDRLGVGIVPETKTHFLGTGVTTTAANTKTTATTRIDVNSAGGSVGIGQNSLNQVLIQAYNYLSNTAEAITLNAYGGRVGVGTQSPQERFVVSNLGGAGIEFNPDFLTNIALIRSYNRSTTAYSSFIIDSLDFNFYTSGSPKMTLTSGGNVGIGTTSPSAKLEVSGSYAQFNGGGIDGTLGEAILFGNTTYPNNQKNRIRSSISASNTGNLLVFETGNGTTGSYNSNQLVLRGDGNVGIGTTSPTAPLHVKGSGAYAGVIVDNTGTTGGGYFAARQNGSQVGIVGVSGAIIGDTSSNMALFSETGKSVDFMTDGSATIKMRITSGGNVGIGTTSPAEKLEVQNGTSGAKIKVSNTGGGYAMLECSSNATSTATLSFTNSLALTGGNVGIGTTSPSVKLQVESSTVAAFIKSSGNPVPISIFNSSSTVSTIGFKGSTTANEYNVRVGADAENFVAYTSDTERMRITSGGNVEIKNSDSRLLGGNTSGRFIVSNSDTSAYVSINGSANATPNNIALITNSQITFNTGASYSESMRITSGGNVGIRTTSPESGWNVDIAGIVAMGSTAGNGRLYVSCANTTNGITYIQARNLSVATPMSYLASSHTFDTNVTAPGFFNSSDIRLKEIVDYDYNVLDIKPITYLWKDGRDNKKHVGYSAQEVQKVMPDAVNEGTDGMLSVNYVEILVAKISQMEKEIELLKSKL